MPVDGELIEQLELGTFSLNNNAKLVTGQTSDSTEGALNLINADFQTANGTCQGSTQRVIHTFVTTRFLTALKHFSVSLKADAGNVFPSVGYTWFVDNEQRATDQVFSFEVSALDTSSTATGF